MLYAYVCDKCGNKYEAIRAVADRDVPVLCYGKDADAGLPGHLLAAMRREVSTPTVHFKGAGWTRTPSIMKDPIAAGHPQERHNWGTDVARDLGDPNLLSPYKQVINESTSADGEVD